MPAMSHRTTIRAATGEDLPGLVQLCLSAREEAGTGSALCTDDEARLREQLGVASGLPGAVLLVATHDDEIDGLLLGRTVGPTLFSDQVAVDLEAVYVRASARRRGIGHALLGGLVTVAEQAGAAEVFASPLPGARGIERFLARVGFQAAASYRVITVTALHRRLADETRPRGGQARQDEPSRISRLIALRRRARERWTAER
ncbi:MAG: GNAT family N-acetyltransferase [Micrococcales bacterium]|nr:GNAT family N-acetyltransferase [Micrococcales bacterium]